MSAKTTPTEVTALAANAAAGDRDPADRRRKRDEALGYWRFSYGIKPHTVRIQELPKRADVLQLTFKDPTTGRKTREHVRMSVRNSKGELDPKKVRSAEQAAVKKNAKLIDGGTTLPRTLPAATTQSHTEETPETLTLEEGFRLYLDPVTGCHPSHEARHVDDVKRARDRLLSPKLLGPTLRWTQLKHAHARKVWRAIADAYIADGTGGPVLARRLLSVLYAVAEWLRSEEKIPDWAAKQRKHWQQDLKKDWERKTGEQIKVDRPRHTADELRSIFAVLRDPRTRLYRQLLRVTQPAPVAALAGAMRSQLTLGEEGVPRILTLHWDRQRRAGGVLPSTHRIRLEGAEQAAVAAALSGHLRAYEADFRRGAARLPALSA